MSEQTSMEKNPPPVLPPPPRRRSRRVLLIAVLFAVVLGVMGLHNAGYAMLIGAKDEPTTNPADSKMLILRCTYFTGTERIINHTFRNTSDTRGKPKCPFVIRMNLGPFGKGDDSDPNVITIPAGRTFTAHPPAPGPSAPTSESSAPTSESSAPSSEPSAPPSEPPAPPKSP